MTYEELKKTLWDAANKLRGSVSAAEYKYPVLGLVFLKYVSDMYDAQAQVIKDRLSDPNSDLFIDDEEIREESYAIFVQDRTFFTSDNVFWVPTDAHFDKLLEQASSPQIPQLLDSAMALIETENSSLNGVLYREFSRLALEPGKLGELVGEIAKLKFDKERHGNKDVFGEVYEYFLGEFAMAEGQRAGEFYTPKSIVNLLVEILAPFKGKIYDPACGSGGMFVMSARFKDAHQAKLNKKGDLAIYGQEKMAETRRLCLMNLAVHGLDGNIGETYGSTFTNDQHKTLRADYILANPPFNIKDWDGDKLKEDPRWVYGTPPVGNANYAWLQHMLARLSKNGRAGVVLAKGSLTSQTNNEGAIRQKMVDEGVVECIVNLPSQLFSNTQIPACLWFLANDKNLGVNGKNDRRNEVLFIDARSLKFNRISRKQIELTEDNLHQISQIYHRWRDTEFSDGGSYKDELGLCASVQVSKIAEFNYVLTPGRYVGLPDEEDDFNFAERFNALKAEFEAQLVEEEQLNEAIVDNLARVKL